MITTTSSSINVSRGTSSAQRKQIYQPNSSAKVGQVPVLDSSLSTQSQFWSEWFPRARPVSRIRDTRNTKIHEYGVFFLSILKSEYKVL